MALANMNSNLTSKAMTLTNMNTNLNTRVGAKEVKEGGI